jgi:hypothetical protein
MLLQLVAFLARLQSTWKTTNVLHDQPCAQLWLVWGKKAWLQMQGLAAAVCPEVLDFHQVSMNLSKFGLESPLEPERQNVFASHAAAPRFQRNSSGRNYIKSETTLHFHVLPPYYPVSPFSL